MSNLVDIIQSVINGIDLNLKVKNVDVDKIYFCGSTLHLTLTKIVVIDGLDYEVIDFELNNWIQVKPYNQTVDTPVPVDTTIVIAPSITFLHGDQYSTNAEYIALTQKTRNKTPFIWLLSSYNYEDLPRDSSIEMAFDARLFFLDWSQELKWLNKDHNDYSVKPMQNLQKAFVDSMREDYNFKSPGAINGTVRTRFGVQINSGNDKQPKKKIIDEDLSGIDCKIKFEVYNVSLCNC